jgi:exonuclease SbcC
MRPLKLTISAFGCYAGLEVIDFTALGEKGLYLVSGETGSGKTTIFDAISYALYGSASGDARSNHYLMFRSDFAPEKAKTFVELEFLCRDKLYTVRRTIKKNTQEVELTLSDGTVISGDRIVTPKISELIGLSRDQFSQIVMIAQNDFLRFLQSGTDERVKIMRQIFNTGSFLNFQMSLKKKFKDVNDERNIILSVFDRLGVDVHERAAVCNEWLEQGIADKKEADKIKIKQDENNKQCSDKAAELALAATLAKNLSELEKAGAALKLHNEKSDEMNRLSANHKRNEIAVRNVKPMHDNLIRIQKESAGALNAATNAKNEFDLSAQNKEKAIKALSELPRLDEAEKKYIDENKLWETENAKLTALLSLQKDKAGIAKADAELISLQNGFAKLSNDYDELHTAFSHLEALFMSNQAGILAASLKDGAPCPVCGSVTHPRLAEVLDETPTEDKVKEAEIAAEAARKKRDEQFALCTAKKSAADTAKERFVADFCKYEQTETYEAAAAALDKIIPSVTAKVNKLKESSNNANDTFKRLKGDHEKAASLVSKAESEYKASEARLGERKENEEALSKSENEAKINFEQSLSDNAFENESEFLSFVVSESELKNAAQMLSDYDNEGNSLAKDIERLEIETRGKEAPNIAKIEEENNALEETRKILRDKSLEIEGRLTSLRAKIKDVKAASSEYEKNEKQYIVIKPLCDAANGKLEFETYAQTAYFDRVLRAANLRLQIMSQNRYMLLRKQESDDNRKKTGLDIEVADSYTGKSRSTKSLSGGESFMASLSLALGLSDVIQQSVGGVKLDAMFIDEGFGSLDSETLDLAVNTLSGMAQGSRAVGIISHVSELRERIDKQIRVEKSPTGSTISVII